MFINGELPKDEKYPLSCVYWIHREGMSDPKTQGYVGVSVRGLTSRVKKHLKASADGSVLHVHRAIAKYDDIKYTVLLEASPEFCLLVEYCYRPHADTAWNLAVGGGAPNLGCKLKPEVVDKMRTRMLGNQYAVGYVHDDAVKKRISEANKGNKHTLGYKFSEEHKEAQSIRMKGIQRCLGYKHTDETRKNMSDSSAKKWTHSKASKIWLHCVELFNVFLVGESVLPFSQKLSVSRSSVFRMAERFRNGWNPNEDQEYLSWLEEKKGTE